MLTETVAGRTYNYGYAVGRGAQAGMGFFIPVAAAFGEGTLVYVVNRGTEGISNVPWNRTVYGCRVGRIAIGHAAGDEEFLGDFSRYGDEDGQLIWPAGIAIDSQQNLYITDEWLNRVSIFDKEGNFLRLWGTVQPGDSEPNAASGIAIDAEENLYVTDGRSHKVRKFTRDGRFLRSWGCHGTRQGEFDMPWGITVDNQGQVYVADFKNHRVQKFTSDGEFVTQFGSHGPRRGQLNYAVDVAVDPDGDVYILDWTKNDWNEGRVHIFDRTGRFLTSLVGDAQELSKWSQAVVDANPDYIKRRREVRTTASEWTFAQPTGVEFDAATGRLLVVDTQRRRVQIYEKEGAYMVPQLNL